MKSRLGLPLPVLVFCGLAFLIGSSIAHAENYQDWWSNPELSGMGLNIGQQGQNIFVTWFMYDEIENPSYLLFYGDLDQNQSLTAELRRYFGPEPQAYDENLWRGEVVGKATIAFSSPETATFSYQYDGKTGSFPIQRYTFRAINLSGDYIGGTKWTENSCGAGSEGYTDQAPIGVTHNGNSVQIYIGVVNGTLEGTLTQHGSRFSGSGSLSLDEDYDGIAENTGTWSSSYIEVTNGVLAMKYALQLDIGCEEHGILIGQK